MTSIILHIEHLLQRNDCVILPGFGALIARRISAGFDMQKGIVTPPGRVISFNPAINHNDGLLANSIARREMVKFEQARSIMNSEIAEIHRQLEDEGEYTLGKIGIFRSRGDSAIDFLPIMSSGRAGAEIGRTPLSIFDRKENLEAGESRENMDSLAAAAAEAAGNAAGVTASGNALSADGQPEMEAKPGYSWRQLSDKNYYIAINKIFAKCAASIAAILVVAFILIAPVANPAPENVRASLNPMESIAAKQAVKEGIRQEAAGIAAEADDAATAAKADAVSESQTGAGDEALAGAGSQSYLIVATFHSPKEAEAFIEARNGGSYELSSIKGKNVWRVAAGHGDEATLRALLNSAEFRAAFSEAWIWKSR